MRPCVSNRSSTERHRCAKAPPDGSCEDDRVRYLAIDLGDKRTGLAAGDDETCIATPLLVVRSPSAPADRLLAAIARAADEQGAEAIVLGLPLNMDGTESARSRQTRAFGQLVSDCLGLPIHYEDERLTSASADWSMAQSGWTRGQKKNRRDAIAAAAILQTFFVNQSKAD